MFEQHGKVLQYIVHITDFTEQLNASSIRQKISCVDNL